MMSTQRLESLQTKHSKIENMISEIEGSAYVDAMEVKRLKMEKLRIKEEMEGLSDAHRRIA